MCRGECDGCLRKQRIWFSRHKGDGERGSVIGWGTMPQAGRSWVRLLNMSLDFFSIYLILPAAICPWGRFLRGKGRPARKSDNLTAIDCRLSRAVYPNLFFSRTPWLGFSFMSTPSLHYPLPIPQKVFLNVLRLAKWSTTQIKLMTFIGFYYLFYIL
jgi:hypothetical protein